MKGSLKRFIKKTSKIQRIAIVAAIMVMIGAVASVSYIATKAASDGYGMYYTTSDGLWNYVWDQENDYKITIVGYNGTDTDIVFPSKTYTLVDNEPHKFEAIDIYYGSNTIFNNIEASEVTSVTIPDNITQIDSSVFYGCSSLTTVNLPDTLTSIGTSAFVNCTSLKSIDFPDSLTFIGENAFYNCTALESAKLPDSLSSLGAYAFSNCTSLSEINIPSKLLSIPNYAFAHTNIKSAVIPYGCTTIGYNAFFNCKQLVNVVIPQSVKKIDTYAFQQCTSLEKVVIPNSVTEMGSGVFYNCTALKSATLSKNVTCIPSEIFSNCSSLTEVKNIGQITRIDGYAFYKCTSLKTLELPDTLTQIYGSAFRASGIDPCTLNLKNVNTIYDYAFAETTFSGEFTIPENVTNLYSGVFYHANVPKLIIPSTVTGVNSDAVREGYIKELVWDTTAVVPYQCMYQNTTLEKLTITKNIYSINKQAFQSCTSLKEVNAKNINYINDYCFRFCSALTTFKAGYIDYIYTNVFYSDTALTTVDAMCTNTIRDYAFYNCTSLTDINKLIKNTQNINSYAFYGCSNLGSVKLGANLCNLYYKAFAYSGITYLDASNFTGTVSDQYAFQACDKLTEVYNWNGTMSWGYTFENCTALEKFTFGPRCTTLNNAAYTFKGCKELEDIYWTNTTVPASINNYFMSGTTYNQTIYYTVPLSGGTDTWLNYYNSYGDTYTFVLAALEPSTEPTVTSVTINPTDITSIIVGESVQLSATITYSDDSTKTATADDVTWTSSGTTVLVVDENGKATGVQNGGNNNYFYITVKSKEANISDSISFKVIEGSTDTDLSATKIELYELMIDSTAVQSIYNPQQFVDGKPFAMDWGNNGINTGSYSHIKFRVYPANTTDEIKVEVIDGEELVTVAEPSIDWYNSDSINYVSGITHIADDDGNFNYGTITLKVTAGDAEPLIYTFELEKESKIPSGASFDNSGSQTQIEVGKTYDYTAFPSAWYEGTGNPYMWYDVTYSIDNDKLADLSVATVEDAAYDANNNKYYTAKVATITPKKPGTIKLKAHSGRYANNYTELTITITDPDNLAVIERPEQSEDPDEIWATSVTFPQDTITLALGKTRNLSPTVMPANNNDELSFYSYDKTIASIDNSTGLITANAVGETTLGVSTSSGLHASIKIVVVDAEVPTTSVKLSPTTLSLKTGDSSILQATIAPADTTDVPVWTSSDTNVVTVNAGAVTAVGQGTATVTVTSGNYSASCTVNVNLTATGVTLNQTTATIKHGETLQLNATVEPAGVTDTVVWKSSNEKIATVSSTGKVTAVGYGDVDITVTVDKVTAKCTISVVPTLDFKILGASIRVSDPYGIRFGIQLGKTGDYGDVKIVEYGTVMMPTEKLGGSELSLATPQVLKVQGKTIYSETSSELVYTGVLINIPESFFNTDVSGRGYLTYEDTAGVQHTIYTDVVSISFTTVAQKAYDSYSKISNPTATQTNVLNKLKDILNIN